ncbi:hypothetical protein CANCADRAFT_690 [Tortispora caseinolytica NRRL Y-17796]|uniref:Nucleoporin Nup159/Nup146 N-terminal domain-containing protein n=1 Tax=Tortispora caseinolytica NRRL Y-17796 TaxID=767744 RepID=A0A1E4TK50_9ASCO|nr:hypothetical protein CANCADRAFT_690 [Tortispora caseinolytica NRRL Y-17796]
MTSTLQEFPDNETEDLAFVSLGNGKSIQLTDLYSSSLLQSSLSSLAIARSKDLLVASHGSTLYYASLSAIRTAFLSDEEAKIEKLDLTKDITHLTFNCDDSLLICGASDGALVAFPVPRSNFHFSLSDAFEISCNDSIKQLLPNPILSMHFLVLTETGSLLSINTNTKSIWRICTSVATAISPNGSHFASSLSNGSIEIYSIESGTKVRVIAPPADLEETNTLSLTWVSAETFLIVYTADKFDPDSVNYSGYIVKKSSAEQYSFEMLQEICFPYGLTERQPSFYIANLPYRINELQNLILAASTCSSDITTLSSESTLNIIEDTARAELPLSDDGEMSPVGMAVDLQSDVRFSSSVPAFNDCPPVPIVYILTNTGALVSWNVLYGPGIPNQTSTASALASIISEEIIQSGGKLTPVEKLKLLYPPLEADLRKPSGVKNEAVIGDSSKENEYGIPKHTSGTAIGTQSPLSSSSVIFLDKSHKNESLHEFSPSSIDMDTSTRSDMMNEIGSSTNPTHEFSTSKTCTISQSDISTSFEQEADENEKSDFSSDFNSAKLDNATDANISKPTEIVGTSTDTNDLTVDLDYSLTQETSEVSLPTSADSTDKMINRKDSKANLDDLIVDKSSETGISAHVETVNHSTYKATSFTDLSGGVAESFSGSNLSTPVKVANGPVESIKAPIDVSINQPDETFEVDTSTIEHTTNKPNYVIGVSLQSSDVVSERVPEISESANDDTMEFITSGSVQSISEGRNSPLDIEKSKSSLLNASESTNLSVFINTIPQEGSAEFSLDKFSSLLKVDAENLENEASQQESPMINTMNDSNKIGAASGTREKMQWTESQIKSGFGTTSSPSFSFASGFETSSTSQFPEIKTSPFQNTTGLNEESSPDSQIVFSSGPDEPSTTELERNSNQSISCSVNENLNEHMPSSKESGFDYKLNYSKEDKNAETSLSLEHLALNNSDESHEVRPLSESDIGDISATHISDVENLLSPEEEKSLKINNYLNRLKTIPVFQDQSSEPNTHESNDWAEQFLFIKDTCFKDILATSQFVEGLKGVIDAHKEPYLDEMVTPGVKEADKWSLGDFEIRGSKLISENIDIYKSLNQSMRDTIKRLKAVDYTSVQDELRLARLSAATASVKESYENEEEIEIEDELDSHQRETLLSLRKSVKSIREQLYDLEESYLTIKPEVMASSGIEYSPTAENIIRSIEKINRIANNKRREIEALKKMLTAHREYRKVPTSVSKFTLSELHSQPGDLTNNFTTSTPGSARKARASLIQNLSGPRTEL